MKSGSSIIKTTSINADAPNPTLLAYATSKGAIQNFTAGLAQLLAEKGIRANAVAPGPIWTPLIPSTMKNEAVVNFGRQVPMKRSRPARRTCNRLRHAGRSAVQLRLGGDDRGNGWKAVHLISIQPYTRIPAWRNPLFSRIGAVARQMSDANRVARVS
jgi:NAD(P)-dependent dehydrogenase (short-subunit alcohol dehydrogenase family)